MTYLGSAEQNVRARIAAPVHSNKAAQRHRLGEAGTAALVGLIATALLVAVNLPFLWTYGVKGDDYALLLHSVSQFAPSAVEWVTHANYGVGIPELSSSTNFVRPTINATIFLESLLIADPFSPWFLATNYLGHAAVVALTYLVARRVVGLDRPWALLAAAIFFGTISAYYLCFSIGFRGDMLATLFSLAALLAAITYLRGSRHAGRLLAIGALLTLAAFSKEAAIAAPLVIGFWWMQHATGLLLWRPRQVYQVLRSDPWLVLALVLPLVLYAVFRLRAGFGGIYALGDLPNAVFGIPTAVLNPLRFLSTAFVPVRTETIKALLAGAASWADVLRMLLALLVNVGAWLSLGWLIWRGKAHSLLKVLALGLVASALPIIIKADPRFMYFGQTLMVPLLVGIVYALYREGALSTVRLSVVAVALVIVSPLALLAQLVGSQADRVQENDAARELHAAVLAELRDPRLRRLYLVNMPPNHGMAAMPEILVTQAGRHDVTSRVVTTLSGPIRVAIPSAGTTVRRQGNELKVETRYGPGQRPFEYLTSKDISRLQASNAVTYGPITRLRSNPWGKQEVDQDSFSVTLPDADRPDYALVGFDPGSDGVHVYKPSSDLWQPFSSAQGGLTPVSLGPGAAAR